eukprot:CCRYP_020548-RA/>CCRYP_020548-RA protein AED:0.44 eAED:0.44 QI:0/0/0/1/0/0/3/0/374
MEITLNLLCQSNATPTVSAYADLNGPFDYNKMPLAPMGCSAHVHEKTHSRRTWAFHSVDGWYINTSPKHYHTHHCHIKSTNSERLSDTVQSPHKHTTNPSLTPADELMAAIAACSQALQTHAPAKGTSDIRQLQVLLQQTSMQLNSSSHSLPSQSAPTMEHPLPRVEQALPRVFDPNMCITRSMTPVILDVPTQPIPLTRHPITHRRSHTPHQSTHLPGILIHKLQPLPRLKPTTHDRLLPAFQNPRQSPTLNPLAWRDSKTRSTKCLQSLTNPQANSLRCCGTPSTKFGRLAQGVGGAIKGTNIIQFIRKSDIPQDHRNDVTYGHFVCNVHPKKAEPNRMRFTVGGDLTKWPPPQPKCSRPNYSIVQERHFHH